MEGYIFEYTGPAAGIIKDIEKRLTWLAKEKGRIEIEAKSREALRVDPKCYPAYVILGYCEHERRNYDRMDAYFLKALDVADQPYNVYTWEGVLEGPLDHEIAVRYLQRFYEKQPEFFVVKYLIWELWKKLGRKQEALSLLNDYLLKHPDDKKAFKLRRKIETSKK